MTIDEYFAPLSPDTPAALVRKLVKSRIARIARIAAKTSTTGGTMPKKPTRKPAAKPQARSAKPRAATPTSTKAKHVPTRGLYSWITHTDLASRDPAATKAWCAKVLGWSFRPPFTSPAGEYHLFTYSEQGGGGIHGLGPGEGPGAVPFVHVADAHAAFDAALRAGAEAVHPPERVMEGVTAAQVRAPGGVIIGFSGP